MQDDVSKWLEERGLSEHASKFLENKIDFAVLAELSVEDLKDMGIHAVGDRRRILRAIEDLEADDGAPPAEEVAPPATAKRQVTVMFVDLTGFTQMSSKLDAEDMHSLLNDFFNTTDAIIKRFGGRIDKHIGDAVMAVFGVPVSTTSDTEKAALAALAIHEALANLVPAMICHIGISSGQVIASKTGSALHTEYTMIGDGVNLSARLTDLAGPGDTLISADAHLALGQQFLGEDLGLTEIHGLEDPIRVLRLTGLLDPATTRRHLFVGRQRELSLFDAAFERCKAHDTGEVHVLLGEPGIGKTHLCEEISKLARENGYVVHCGTVMDFGGREGHSAIQSIVHGLLDVDIEANVAQIADALQKAEVSGWISPSSRPHLQALLEVEQEPGAAEVYANLDNSSRLRGQRQATSELIRACSANAPLLFQIEDIHWASAEILSACAHIAATINDLPCVLVMSSRLDGYPLDLDWQSQTNGAYLTRIELAGLSVAQARQLIRAMVEEASDSIDALIERAEGNPLFLEQLLRSRDEIGTGGVPGTIQGIVQSRLDAIDATARATIQAASVLGQRFSREALAVLLDQAAPIIQPLIRAGLLRESGSELIFAHALIRDGSYESLLKAERARLHERAAMWYDGKDATLRAQHLDRAQSPLAAQAYLEAVEKLIRSYQFQSAEPLLERALKIALTSDQRLALLGTLGEVMRLQGRPNEALLQCDAAVGLAETDAQLCRIHIERAQSARQASKYDEALDSLQTAESAAKREGNDHDLAQVHYLRGNIYFPLGRFQKALESNEQALTLARALGSVRLEVGALSGFGDAFFMKGAMRTAAEYYLEAVTRARPAGLVRDLAANLHNLSVARSYCGDVNQGVKDALEAVEVSQKHSALVPECVAQTCLGVAYTLLDRMEDALLAFENSAEVGRRVGAKRLEAQALEHLARAQVYLGLSEVAERTGRDAVELALKHGPSFVGPKSLSALALALQDPEEQDRLLAQGHDIIAGGCVGHNYLHFFSDACAIMLDRGDWNSALSYAADLDAATKEERLPLVDLVLDEIRHLAEAGRSGLDAKNASGYASLSAQFSEMGIRRSLSGRVDFVT